MDNTREVVAARAQAADARIKAGETVAEACKTEHVSPITYRKWAKKTAKRNAPKKPKRQPELVTVEAASPRKVVCLIGTPDDIAEVIKRGVH